MEFVTWDVGPNTDLMVSITQANLRSAFTEFVASKESKEPSKED